MMKKTTIMHLMPKSDGGIMQHIKTIVLSMDQLPYSSIIVGPENNPLGRELGELGYSFEPIKWHSTEHLNIMFLLLQIRRLVKKHQPVLIHCHGHKMSLAGRLALKSMDSGSRAIVTVHNFTPKSTWGKALKIVNCWLDGDKVTSQVIAVSKALLEEEVGNNSKACAQVIYNGVDIYKFDSTFKRYESIDQIKIGVVARLAPQKGLPYLIEALSIINASYPKVSLVIVGFGPEKDQLLRQIANRGLDSKIEILEGVSDVQPILQQIDIFVMPSLSEGLSIATIEAMASAKPIVASNVGGLKELIIHGETGILVPPGDARQLSKGIIQLIEDGNLAYQLGIKARQRALQFTREQMISKTHQVYLDIITKE